MTAAKALGEADALNPFDALPTFLFGDDEPDRTAITVPERLAVLLGYEDGVRGKEILRGNGTPMSIAPVEHRASDARRQMARPQDVPQVNALPARALPLLAGAAKGRVAPHAWKYLEIVHPYDVGLSTSAAARDREKPIAPTDLERQDIRPAMVVVR